MKVISYIKVNFHHTKPFYNSSNRLVSSWIALENRLKSLPVSAHVVTEMSLVSELICIIPPLRENTFFAI